MLPIFPGIDFGPLLAVMPVAGVAFLFRDLLSGDAGWLLGGLVLVSTTLYAGAALLFAARAFGNERVLFGGQEEADVTTEPLRRPLGSLPRSGRVPTGGQAAALVAMVAVLFFFGGIRLQLALGEAGLMAAEWLFLFAPAVFLVASGRFDAVRTLSLRAPAPAHLLAGVLLIFGALPAVWVVGWLQSFVLPIPWELLEGLEQLMTAQTPGRFVWLVVLLALTPALCEEIVFRGVLLGSTRTLEPWRMIALNGLVFGAFHLSFETVIRFLPTALLGALIAWAVWRSGSIWVGTLMHFLNNGMLVVLTSLPVVREVFSDPEAPPPLWLVPLGVAAFALGVRVMTSQPSAAEAEP
jgi:sodium transport system permease protein